MVCSTHLSGSLSIHLEYTNALGLEPVNGLLCSPKRFAQQMVRSAHLSGSFSINF